MIKIKTIKFEILKINTAKLKMTQVKTTINN